MKKDEKTDKKFIIDEFRGILKGTNYTAEDAREMRTRKTREYYEKIAQKGGDSSTSKENDS